MSKLKVYIATILLMGSIGILWAKSKEGSSAAVSNEGQVVVTGAKAWALGCAAVLTERNHDRHDLLGGQPRTERSIQGKKELLDEWWGINSKEDLLDDLQWLELGGDRIKFEGRGIFLQTIVEEEYQKILEEHEDNEEFLQELRVAEKYYKQLGLKSLLGWDYGRYICLCRWSYMTGYISEDEAWEKIMPVAKMLQKTFDSWEDLGRNYLIGRQFRFYKKTKENGYLYEDAVQRLLDMPSSPWNIYPWNMDLTDANTVNELNGVKKSQIK